MRYPRVTRAARILVVLIPSVLVLVFAMSLPCAAVCQPTDGITLHLALDPGGESVVMSWSGGFPLFHVYRSDTPATLTDPACWIGDTTERAWSDLPPPGVAFFYTITGVTCMPGEPETCDCVDNNCDGTTDGPGSEASCALAHAQPACVDGLCTVLACDNNYGDCNLIADDGCEVDLGQDPVHCGACESPCDLPHATESCANGTCGIAACDAMYGNCDGATDSGCEQALDSDPDHCGACDVQCRNLHGTTFCGGGECRPLCDEGWDDCDGNPVNGCEAALTSLANCGACGLACDIAHATESCATGECLMTGCEPGWGDCNLAPADGCEIDLNSNAAHCGACTTPCTLAHATPACVGGGCRVSSCQAGWGNCNLQHPDGCEINLTSNPSHCGSCGFVCNLAHTAVEACVASLCMVSICDSGWGNCNAQHFDGCETSLRTTANCGSCGLVCAPPNGTGTCPTGACEVASCNVEYSNCNGTFPPDGCEVHHNSDPACDTFQDLGSWCGDTECHARPLGFCDTAPVWRLFAQRWGQQEAWFKAHASECSSCSAGLAERITLWSTNALLDWDLEVYSACGGALIGSSRNAAGMADVVTLTRADNPGVDDGFDYLIRIVWFSGADCAGWYVNVEGMDLGSDCSFW